MNKEKLLIIGAGISGLYTAYLLQEHYDIRIVEARERVGGRILTVQGHDLGPSWVWGHQKHILGLISSLGLELVEQYTQGDSLYDSPEGVQRFNPPASAPSERIKGGLREVVNALEMRLKAPVLLETVVLRMLQKEQGIVVETDKGVFEAAYVVSTLPPRLAVQSIAYVPDLPEPVQTQFQNIPTWMGYASKCVIEFDEAFWRKEGLSGFAFSHLGPLGEIHDACTEERAALFGFLHSQAKRENIEAEIKAQLLRLYGEKAAKPKNMYLLDWTKEKYTSTRLDALPLRAHPHYGFDVTHFDGKLIFSGTESAFQEGGYLEGALEAAKRIEAELLV